MKVRARLELDFESPEEAGRMLESLKADDDGFIVQRVDGSTILIEAEGDTPGAVRQILEDYLSCMAGALASAVSVRNGAKKK